MAKIRIIAVPGGEAPEWVRREWLGVEIPVLEDQPKPALLVGALGGPANPANSDGYNVSLKAAVQVLREKNTPMGNAAAKWWEQNIIVRASGKLRFGKAFCKYASS